MNIIKKITAILLLTVTFNGFSQTYNYDVFYKNVKHGFLTVTYVNEDSDILKVFIRSEVKIKVISKIDFLYTIQSVFQKEQLLNSSVVSYINGNLHSKSNTLKDKKKYLITINGHKYEFDKEILYSGSLLYIKEPVNYNEIYSETDGLKKSIKQTEPNIYQIINPKTGKSNKYYYETGILKKAEINDALLSFKIVKT